MRPVSDMALLEAWERGSPRPPIERALGLAAAARPDAAPGELVDLSTGELDAALLRLRELAFGPLLLARTSCPACGEALELELPISDILGEREGAAAGTATITIEHDGHQVELRFPSSRDLLRIRGQSPEDPRRSLFEQCVVRATRQGRDIDPAALPDSMFSAAAERMSEASPLADVQLDLGCAGCGHPWQTRFDIGAFLWTEVDAWARRLLADVHALALAYGWTEAEILAVSPRRRELYLGMVAQ